MRSVLAVNVHNAGLGNRIRFTLSAELLARHSGRKFEYVWQVSEAFNGAMTDLWEYPESCVDLQRSKEIWPTVPRGDEKTDYFREKIDEDVWHIHSAQELPLPDGSPKWEDRFRQLVPIPEIASRIEAWKRKVPDSYVGVQIRAHPGLTHAKTLEASPVEWYIRRMREVQERSPGQAFFVSCDVAEVQDSVIAAVPNCFALSDKGAYNSRDALQSSVVDLYLLAGAQGLLGPYWSSFVDMAWELADRRIPLETSRRLLPGSISDESQSGFGVG